MKIEKIKEKNTEQLENLCDDLRAEIFQLRNELAMNRKLEKPHLIKEKRHALAKARTVITQRQKEGN